MEKEGYKNVNVISTTDANIQFSRKGTPYLFFRTGEYYYGCFFEEDKTTQENQNQSPVNGNDASQSAPTIEVNLIYNFTNEDGDKIKEAVKLGLNKGGNLAKNINELLQEKFNHKSSWGVCINPVHEWSSRTTGAVITMVIILL